MFGIIADSIPLGRDEGTTLKIDLDLERWSVADAAELYEVARWGKGYFSVNRDGHVCVHPTKDPERSIDLKQLVDRLQLRGIDLPILIRFADILKHRLGEIHDAFQAAIDRAQVSGQLLLRLSDQGEPAAAGRRGSAGLRQAVSSSAWRPAASRSCWPSWRWPRTTRRSSATASRTPSSSRWRCWPRRSAATSFRSSRNTPSWA